MDIPNPRECQGGSERSREKGAVAVNSTLVTTRPMPVEQAIHWKPLRDPHYILASLQPADGGRRKIVIRQQVLAHVQTLVRGRGGRRVAGLLVGRFYRCPITSSDYQVIESHIDRSDAGTDDVVSTIGQALDAAKQHEGSQVLGWYCSTPSLGAKLSDAPAAVHRSYFRDPWQTTLVVTGGGSDGAFFLYDDAAARWFYAPFYELPDHARAPEEPKPTCITWPQYMTVDNVVAVHVDEPMSNDPIFTPAASDTSATTPRDDGSVALSTPLQDEEAHEPPPPEPPVPPFEPVPPSLGGLLAQTDLMSADERRLTPEAQPDTKTDPPPDIAAGISVERGADAIRRVPAEETPKTDERRQWSAGPRKAARRTGDIGGTAKGNDAELFIETARSEGFIVAATFASVAKARRSEAVWVLADADAGILLTVAATSTQVLDATLHYNLRTTEEGLRRIPFPKHRDLASRTVYLRETCLDMFPEKCRALRERSDLEREWKVSPIIYFLTPSEWQSFTLSPADPEQCAYRIQMLNHERVSALPEAIRHQFGLKA